MTHELTNPPEIVQAVEELPDYVVVGPGLPPQPGIPALPERPPQPDLPPQEEPIEIIRPVVPPEIKPVELDRPKNNDGLQYVPVWQGSGEREAPPKGSVQYQEVLEATGKTELEEDFD